MDLAQPGPEFIRARMSLAISRGVRTLVAFTAREPQAEHLNRRVSWTSGVPRTRLSSPSNEPDRPQLRHCTSMRGAAANPAPGSWSFMAEFGARRHEGVKAKLVSALPKGRLSRRPLPVLRLAQQSSREN
jgi:hypothetical protein